MLQLHEDVEACLEETRDRQRQKHIWKALEKVAKQSSPNADVLFANFRYDISSLALTAFLQQYGVTLGQLADFQQSVPVLFPWNKGYDSLRFDVNRRFNVFPLMIVVAAHDQDVAAALGFARHVGLKVSLRSGAHSAEGYSTVQAGLVIDQSCRTRVWINVKRKQVRVESGVLIGPLLHKLWQVRDARDPGLRLVLPTGTCPNVGICGLTLGGGIGFLTRQYGLTSDRLVGVDMMLADGRLLRASGPLPVAVDPRTNNSFSSSSSSSTVQLGHEHQRHHDRHKDLLWASRGGGGGNFGIVTRLTLQLAPLSHCGRVLIFTLTYPVEAFAAVVRAWQSFAATRAPDSLTSELDLATPSVLDMTQRPSLVVTGLYVGGTSRRRLRKILRPLLRLTLVRHCKTLPTSIGIGIGIGKVQVDIQKVSFLNAARNFAGIHPHRFPFFKVKNAYVQRRFSSRAIRIIERFMLTHKAPPDTRFEVDAQGGLVSRIPIDATAYPHRPAHYWMLLTSYWDDDTETAARLAWMTEFYEALLPQLDRPLAAYVNQIDAQQPDFLRAYYGQNLQRLIRIKQRYDPNNVFAFPQGIPPTTTTRRND